MTPAAAPTFDMDSDGQDARSGIWRFGAPEYYALAAMVSIAIATYIFVTGDAQSERLLTPALVAAIMVANLVPAMALIRLDERMLPTPTPRPLLKKKASQLLRIQKPR